MRYGFFFLRVKIKNYNPQFKKLASRRCAEGFNLALKTTWLRRTYVLERKGIQKNRANTCIHFSCSAHVKEI